MSAEHASVVIVGAGFGGICTGVKLREAGIDDFLILEREEGVGGTWRINDYPGCACDISSHLYSFSFAPKPDWSRFFATQPEIRRYLEDIVADHGLGDRIALGVELLDATWSEAGQHWAITTSAGAITADVLVSATGVFGAPSIPDVPGMDTFNGPVFHSARWNHDVELRGKRVAVVGTGASAVQFVPAIQPLVERLVVFQRTPAWILPRFDRPTSRLEHRLLRRIPVLQRLLRGWIYLVCESLGLVNLVDMRFGWMFHSLGRWQLRRQVPDRKLRARLTPDYVVGCKRAILSDGWYPALVSSNVEVVDGGVAEVRESGVVTADGTEHPVDVIVFGTGFDVPQRGTERITGRAGQRLSSVLDERPQSYKGLTFSGFPNLFMFLGAFSFAGNQSAVYTIEAQTRYIVDAIRTMRRQGLRTIEVRPDRQEAFTAEAERRSAATVWLRGGCSSYYQTPTGGNNGLWPDWSFRYARQTMEFDADAYVVETAAMPPGM